MNHLEHFRLAEEPFSNLPDPRFFFTCAEQSQAIEHCLTALTQVPDCALVTASAGMGKTSLARRLAEVLPSETWQVCRLVVPCAALTSRGLLRRILALLCGGAGGASVVLPHEASSRDALAAAIAQRLAALCAEGRQAVLVIDEAQMLEDSQALDALGRLCAHRAADLPHLALILFGQSGCEGRLSQALAESGLGRPAHHALEALFPATVSAYVRHRLERAGSPLMPFTPEALDALHRLSQGNVRRVNQLCDAALFEATRARRDTIDQAMIERVGCQLAPLQRPWAPAPFPAAAGEGALPADLGEIDRFLGRLQQV